MLREGDEFVINLPSSDMARQVDFVGIYTGAKMDKFERCGLTKQRSEKVSAPTIAECPIALECRVCEVLSMGSHDVFMADIVSVSCREDILDENGKMRFDRADLLAYAHGEYYTLGEVVGRFGFSTDKKKSEEKKSASKPATKKVEEKKPAQRSSGKGTAEKKKPFYESAPKSKRPKRKPTDKNKGAPHGRRTVEKK